MCVCVCVCVSVFAEFNVLLHVLLYKCVHVCAWGVNGKCACLVYNFVLASGYFHQLTLTALDIFVATRYVLFTYIRGGGLAADIALCLSMLSGCLALSLHGPILSSCSSSLVDLDIFTLGKNSHF